MPSNKSIAVHLHTSLATTFLWLSTATCTDEMVADMAVFTKRPALLVDQVWSISPALVLLPLDCSRRRPFACGVNSWGRATPMQAKWIELDLHCLQLYHALWLSNWTTRKTYNTISKVDAHYSICNPKAKSHLSLAGVKGNFSLSCFTHICI